MNTEIEKKFLIKYLPKGLKIDRIINIRQDYIYKDKLTLVRVRKVIENNECKYVYTVKTKGDIDRKTNLLSNNYEIENFINYNLYKEILNNKNNNLISNTIDKTRCVIDLSNGLKAEIDIYYGFLKGLVTCEVEFKDINELNNFNIPDWFGDELGYDKFSNSKLSTISKEKFDLLLDKDIFNNNFKIIDDFKKIYNIDNIK